MYEYAFVCGHKGSKINFYRSKYIGKYEDVVYIMYICLCERFNTQTWR